MKLQISNFKFQAARTACALADSGDRQPTTGHSVRAFTLVEIAICLGIIGIALVGIVGVLPYGLHTQKDSRQETAVGQDASVLFETVRSGSRGADDLTNYVYAVLNSWSNTTTHVAQRTCYYNSYLAAKVGFIPSTVADNWNPILTNGANIIGLMSTPEFTGVAGSSYYADTLANQAIPSLMFGGVSNHIVAYVSSLSGVTAEKPAQDNDILRQNAFAYRVYCMNASVPVDTNLFSAYPVYQSQTNGRVFYNFAYWQASPNTVSTNIPGLSPNWINVSSYPLQQQARQRELRQNYLWPLLPNGNTGNNRQTFRAAVGGKLIGIITNGLPVYFYQPQTFSAAH